MELLKLATEWAKSEVFSTRFFIVFAIVFLITSIIFWQLGKTDLAKAYIIPNLIAGILLMTIGLGLFYTNKSRVIQFEQAFKENKQAFLNSEIERTESTLKEYKVVFTVIPILLIIASLIIIFVGTSTWRAISITSIAMLTTILLIDGTAYSRMEHYYENLSKIRLKKTQND